MNNDQQPLTLGLAQQSKTRFVFGMKRVGNENGKRIAKSGRRLCERNAMLALIGLGFGVIPLKTKFHKPL